MNYRNFNDYELLDKVNESEEANEILFEKYKPLINGIARKKYQKNNAYELSDLVSEGMIGFSIAINTFNPSKDVMFFTYAKTCVERRICSAILSFTRQKHKILNESISMEENEDNIGLINILSDNSLNPETMVLADESVNDLIVKLDKELSDNEKQVFELKKSGFEITEIAEILDKEYKSIDNTIQRIKNKFKKITMNNEF